MRLMGVHIPPEHQLLQLDCIHWRQVPLIYITKGRCKNVVNAILLNEPSTPLPLGGISLAIGAIRTLASNWTMSQTGHNSHSYNPVNYQHYTGGNLVYYINRTIAIYWSISQTWHDPHGFNPVNYQRHYNWPWSSLLCQPDSSDLLINVSNSTRFTRLQPRELSTPLHWGQSCLLYQPDNSNLLINVSNRTRSTWLHPCELSTPKQLAVILFAMSTGR